MTRLRLAFLVLLSLLLVSAGAVSSTASAQRPIDPRVLADTANGRTGHFLVVLSQQAQVRDRGPSFEVLGQTLDDAAGEAFDKGARLLGLGYPGGPALERLARDGDPQAFAFPIAARVAGLDFSFAGLKTALLYRVRELEPAELERRRADLAASYQHAIVEALTLRVRRGLAQTGLHRLAIGGGVAANGPLRERLAALDVELDVPPRELCTDNAAMIASAARFVAAAPYPQYLRASERFSFQLVERDIEADEALLRKYLERIPVVEIDGVERFELIIDEAELFDALAQLRSRVPHQ